MMPQKNYAQNLRLVRKIHRTTGIVLFLFFMIIAITGLLLGWKKNSNGIILPKSYQGSSIQLQYWLPLDTLQTIAFQSIQHAIDKNIDLELQRIDIRPEKGMVKFIFNNHYWGVQLDGATGNVLAITNRRSDLIENIHDGSILDIIFGIKGEIIKLIYTSIMGTALLIFTLTGFWLWYGPKLMRKNKSILKR
mgnify:CR=1 FL=1